MFGSWASRDEPSQILRIFLQNRAPHVREKVTDLGIPRARREMFFCHRPNLISFSSFHLLPLLSCGGGRCRSKCGSGGECAAAWLSSSLSFPLSSLSSLSRTSLTTEDMASVAEIHVTATRGRQCPADGGSSLRLVPLACALLSGRWGGEASLRYWLVLAGNSMLLACALLRRVMFVCALLRWAVMCVSVEKSLGSGNLECM